MRVLLHHISKCDDRTIELRISFGQEPERTFLAEFRQADPKCQACSVDYDLFMRLSDLAVERFGNSAVYHMELMGIVAAFSKGKEMPAVPAALGSTRYCTLRPGRARILLNKFRRLLDRFGLFRMRVTESSLLSFRTNNRRA